MSLKTTNLEKWHHTCLEMPTRSCQPGHCLLVTRENATARLPTRGSDGAAGYDLSCNADIVIEPGERRLVPTGVSIELPAGTYGRIAPRSGLAVRHGIQVGAGVVDADYRGEVKVLLFNQGSETFSATIGDRIAQLVIECIKTPDVLECSKEAMATTSRGSDGFGSTG